MDIRNAPTEKDFKHNPPNVGFYLKQHQYALKEWAKEAEEYIKKLEHHRDTTVGLWATDRPDLVKDTKKIMFEITDY
jgi:hypothetical protein